MNFLVQYLPPEKIFRSKFQAAVFPIFLWYMYHEKNAIEVPEFSEY